MSTPCYVYIIGHAAGGALAAPVKGGITSALGSRLSSLQTGNSTLLEVGFYFILPSRQEALISEKEFHDTMADYRLQGEWFGIEPLYALETLTGIVFDLLERRYEGQKRRAILVESGAIDNLHTVTTEFWGLPDETESGGMH